MENIWHGTWYRLDYESYYSMKTLLEHRMQLPECTVVIEFPRPPAYLVLLRKGTASLVDLLLQDLYTTPHSHPCNIPSSGFKPVQARVR